MPLTFIIPITVVLLVAMACVIAFICEIAYEQGYDDACHDWRNTVLYQNGDVLDAEVIDEMDTWPSWAEVNAEQSTAYPPSMNQHGGNKTVIPIRIRPDRGIRRARTLRAHCPREGATTMANTLVHSIRFVGNLYGDTNKPVFSGVNPDGVRVLFQTDRAYAGIIRQFVITHGTEFYAEVTPNPDMTAACPEHCQ